MSKFSGSYEHSLDEKGRIIIPQAFREGLGDSFVITRGIGKCLFVFPKAYWESDFENVMKDLPIFDEDAITIQRHFCAEAMTNLVVDSQGRVALSQALREFGAINHKLPVKVCGIFSRIEIWDKALWTAQSSAVSDTELLQAARRTGLGKALAI